MTIEIQDLIAQLQRFDPTAKVKIKASALEVDGLKDAEEAVNGIRKSIEEADEIDEDLHDGEKFKVLQNIIKDISGYSETLGPVWEDVYSRKTESDELEVCGVESKNSQIGVHAVIICNE